MSSPAKQIGLFLSLSIVSSWPCAADSQKTDGSIKIISEYTYQMGDKDTKDKSRALALFGAKLKTINLAAKYLTHKGILEHYEKKQGEIFCLTANDLTPSIIEEKFSPDKKSYYFKIQSEVTSIDFVKAQIKDSELERKESGFSYSEQMEQPVSKFINPGEELSRAYRYIREERWRISIIYLDHLEKKYPHWGDLYLAKAIALYGMDDIDNMLDALETACSLNNQEACNELLSFSKSTM